LVQWKSLIAHFFSFAFQDGGIFYFDETGLTSFDNQKTKKLLAGKNFRLFSKRGLRERERSSE